jgi:hypothetical protein
MCIQQISVHTSVWANMTYNMHSAQSCVTDSRKTACGWKQHIDDFGRASTTYGMEWISPIPKISPKFFLGITERDGRYLQRPPIHI